MYIRFFIEPAGPLGELAHSFVPALLRIAPVRLVLAAGGELALPPPWSATHMPLLSTPMDETPDAHGNRFINVVCCAPEHWVRNQRFVVPGRPGEKTETIERTIELYTEGVRNIIILAAWHTPDRLTPNQRATLAKYQAQMGARVALQYELVRSHVLATPF